MDIAVTHLNLLYFLCPARNSSCDIHTEFECSNGECIDYQFTCDGIAHCKDKSDEKMQYCGKDLISPTDLLGYGGRFLWGSGQ